MENIIRDLEKIDVTITENAMIDRIRKSIDPSDLDGLLKLLSDLSGTGKIGD
jgi:hypothetical protein